MLGFYIALFSLFLSVSTVKGTVDTSAYGSKFEDLVKLLHSNCVARSGTDEASIKNVMNGQFTDEPKIKAYMRCVFTDSSAIDENGNFNTDMIAAQVPPELLDAVLANTKTCDAKTNGISKVEDRIFAFVQCTYNLSPETFIFF